MAPYLWVGANWITQFDGNISMWLELNNFTRWGCLFQYEAIHLKWAQMLTNLILSCCTLTFKQIFEKCNLTSGYHWKKLAEVSISSLWKLVKTGYRKNTEGKISCVICVEFWSLGWWFWPSWLWGTQTMTALISLMGKRMHPIYLLDHCNIDSCSGRNMEKT